jgi:hypothetical protein
MMRDLHGRCTVIPVGGDHVNPEALGRDCQFFSELTGSKEEERSNLSLGLTAIALGTHLILTLIIGINYPRPQAPAIREGTIGPVSSPGGHPGFADGEEGDTFPRS